MTEMEHYSGLMDSCVGRLDGFGPGVQNVSRIGMDALDITGLDNTGGLPPRTNASSTSSEQMLSTLPTPASTSEQRSTKKRSSNDRHSTRTTSPHSEASSEHTDKVVKRQRNTEAARRYRQRKVDRVTELEEALAAMTKERDDFKLKLARSETEVDVLRRLVGKGS